MAVKGIVFHQEMKNPLGKQTEWEEHETIVVGVHQAYGFNDLRVPNVVEILQLDGDNTMEAVEDFRDYMTSKTIVTTPAGARELARLLIAAADEAEG